jgi:hypothetical protein
MHPLTGGEGEGGGREDPKVAHKDPDAAARTQSLPVEL